MAQTSDMLTMVAKYDALFEYLCRSGDAPVAMTFEDIERLVGPLPASARQHRPWWGNEQGGGRHVQATAWLNACREVEYVDLVARRVRFSAAGWRRDS